VRVRQVTDPRRCPTQLQPGEAKRVPIDRARALIGYYIACPRCGMLNMTSVLDREQSVVEVDGALYELLPGVECNGGLCHHTLSVRDGRFVETP
jgi:hypothetical protein